MKELIIGENDSGQRADKFISKLMPSLPKSMLYKGFRKNCVKVNGKHLKDGSVFLNKGDLLTLYFKDEFFRRDDVFKYQKPEMDIVYEDNNIIVINKASGLLTHTDENGHGKNLADMVKSYLYDKGEYDPKTELSFKPALCNRLDRNTGGLIIAAKNAAALREMNKALKEGHIQKFYTAIAEGQMPKSGHLINRLSRNGKKTTVTENGKTAELTYVVKSEKDGFSLLEIELMTGRTHQIRSQLSQIGHPLAGDTKYGGEGEKFRQALWSTAVIFHFESDSVFSYLNNKKVAVTAPFAKKFEE